MNSSYYNWPNESVHCVSNEGEQCAYTVKVEQIKSCFLRN